MDNIPFLMVGGGARFNTGRAIDFEDVTHNRMWLSVAHGLGVTDLHTFGSEALSEGGPLSLS